MYSGKLVMKDGKLVFYSGKDKLAYSIFLDKIGDGEIVEMYVEISNPDHSKAQLAKVHACIRELAKESGYTFEEMKLVVKEQAGLTGKSFADCSKSDLMLAIETCLQIGRDNYNLNL